MVLYNTKKWRFQLREYIDIAAATNYRLPPGFALMMSKMADMDFTDSENNSPAKAVVW